MTVGLADVSSRVGLSNEQEAEKFIRDMVSSTLKIDVKYLFFSFLCPLSLSLSLSLSLTLFLSLSSP